MAMANHSREMEGFLEVEDLAGHRSEWVQPIAADYRGWRIYECPPNGQGLIALVALKLLEGLEMPEWGSAEHLHRVTEALKLAVADGHAYIADPDHAEVPVEALLSEEYASVRRAEIRPGQALPQPQAGQPLAVGQDTVYLCTAGTSLSPGPGPHEG